MTTTSTDIVSETMADRVAFALVAPIMLLWYGWCRYRGSIHPRVSLRFACRMLIRGPQRGSIGAIELERGHCYCADMPGQLMDDSFGRSAVSVYEDGRPLSMPHAGHEEIRRDGAGRFSHWDGRLWFSSSDNTDPRTNGRHYTFREVWT